MKTSPVKNLALLWFLGCMIFSTPFSPALAHSTKGLVKVPLNKKAITVDDAAYFVESYVHCHLYDDNTKETENRFFVKDFIDLESHAGRAEVRFQVLDKKTNQTFDDSLQLERGKKGIWHYQPQGGGAPLEVFTYVRKSLYSWDKYGKKLSIAAGLLYFGILVRGWHRKRRNALGALAGIGRNNTLPPSRMNPGWK